MWAYASITMLRYIEKVSHLRLAARSLWHERIHGAELFGHQHTVCTRSDLRRVDTSQQDTIDIGHCHHRIPAGNSLYKQHHADVHVRFTSTNIDMKYKLRFQIQLP